MEAEQVRVTYIGTGVVSGVWGGWGDGMFVPPPPLLLTPHFYFPLELYVYITLTNNYLAFIIYTN